jgi:hypothetical protein
MPQKPSVRFCVICEAVRAEPNGKANILGFYGVAPSVSILIQELGKPIPALMFLFGLSGPSDPVLVGARLSGPDGSVLVTTEHQPELEIRVAAVPANVGALTGLGFAGVKFMLKGPHKVELLINDKPFYENTFTINEGYMP